MTLSTRSVRTGPGSRGGMWHDPEYRRAYHRAWRAAHPEYREREALRAARRRDPDAVEAPHFPRPLPSPNADLACGCPDCSCTNTVPVVSCGMCLTGLHEVSA